MEIISGYEGKDLDKFLKEVKGIWEKGGSKERGAKSRYQIIIGRINNRAALVPTVSTRRGTESIIIWNLSQENIKKIEEEAKNIGIPISSRPHLWFEKPPAVLPNEHRKS